MSARKCFVEDDVAVPDADAFLAAYKEVQVLKGRGEDAVIDRLEESRTQLAVWQLLPRRATDLALFEQIGTEENVLGIQTGMILSQSGVGEKTAATVLPEANEAIRARNLRAVRCAPGGIAPVTRLRGIRKVVIVRQACNGRLRTAPAESHALG